jgi:uncharacterized protein (TIGR02145 family)
MRKTIKCFIGFAFLLFLLLPFAFAESEYVEDWVGTWTIRMMDNSTVTWDITHTWVSDTGKSHLAYGISNPGNVEFQIYFGTMFKNHNYIEISHKITVYDLPMLFTKYTKLIPSDDFKSFTAKKGRYPINDGMKEIETSSPSPGAVVINNDETAYRTIGTDDQKRTAENQKSFTAQKGAYPVKEEIKKTKKPVSKPGEALTDVEGNTYQTVRIGDQVWMAENLKTITYNDGAPIPCPGPDNTVWQNNTDGAYSWHNNDISNKDTYGALYSWQAVMNSSGLCPTDWHVPTDEEWQTLVDYLGGDDLAGGPMKSTFTEPEPHPCWNTPNDGATNSSGFSGLPGGLRRSNGSFREISLYGAWWAATDGDEDDAWHRSIFFMDTVVYHFIYGKGSGMSIRCVKD